jgi:hypothetical protein
MERTTMIWPQRIFVAGMGSSFCGFRGRGRVCGKAPVDAAVAARDAGDVAAKLLFEGGRPGHELEAEAVIDHGEAAGGEREALAIGAGDIFAGRAIEGRPVSAASFSPERLDLAGA